MLGFCNKKIDNNRTPVFSKVWICLFKWMVFGQFYFSDVSIQVAHARDQVRCYLWKLIKSGPETQNCKRGRRAGETFTWLQFPLLILNSFTFHSKHYIINHNFLLLNFILSELILVFKYHLFKWNKNVSPLVCVYNFLISCVINRVFIYFKDTVNICKELR